MMSYYQQRQGQYNGQHHAQQEHDPQQQHYPYHQHQGNQYHQGDEYEEEAGDWSDDFDTDDDQDYENQEEGDFNQQHYPEQQPDQEQQLTGYEDGNDDDIYDMPEPDEVVKLTSNISHPQPFSRTSPGGVPPKPAQKQPAHFNNRGSYNQQQQQQQQQQQSINRKFDNPPQLHQKPQPQQNRSKPALPPPQQQHDQQQQQQQEWQRNIYNRQQEYREKLHQQQQYYQHPRSQTQQQQTRPQQQQPRPPKQQARPPQQPSQQKQTQQQKQEEEDQSVSVSNRKAMFESNWAKQIGSTGNTSSKFGPKSERPSQPLKKPPSFLNQRPTDNNNNNNNNNNNIKRSVQQEVQQDLYEVTEGRNDEANTSYDDSREEMYVLPQESENAEDFYEVSEDQPPPPPPTTTTTTPITGSEFINKLRQMSVKQQPPPLPEGRLKPQQKATQQPVVEEETYEVCESNNVQEPTRPPLPSQVGRRSNPPSATQSPQGSFRDHKRPPPHVEEQTDYEVVTQSQIPEIPRRGSQPPPSSRQLSPFAHQLPSSKTVQPIEPTANSDSEEDYLIPGGDQPPSIPARGNSPKPFPLELQPRNSLAPNSTIPPVDRLHKPRGSDGACLSRATRERLERTIVKNGWLSGLEFPQENINRDVMRVRSKLTNQLKHEGPAIPLPQNEGNKVIHPSNRPPPQLPPSRPSIRVPEPTLSPGSLSVLSSEETTGAKPPSGQTHTLPARSSKLTATSPTRSQSVVQSPRNAPSNNPLSSYPWYKGGMQRNESESLLRNNSRVGNFVVRNASRGGGYSISILDNGNIRNLKLNESNGKYYLGSSIQGFNSIPEMISFHQNNHITLNTGGQVKLTK